MATQILMPALSPTMEEGKLAKWLVHEGDEVIVNPGVSCGRCRECLAGRVPTSSLEPKAAAGVKAVG